MDVDNLKTKCEQLMLLTYSSESKNIVHHVLNKVRVGVDFHDGKSTSWSQQPMRFLKNLYDQHPDFKMKDTCYKSEIYQLNLYKEEKQGTQRS